MFIIKATIDDFERIRAFDRQYKDARSPYNYDMHWINHLTCESEAVYLAVQNDEIKGLLHASDARGETEIKHLFSAPSCRKKGVGTALLKAVLNESDDKNYEATLCVVYANDEAIRLYKKFGFAVHGAPCFTGIMDMVRAPAALRNQSPRFG